MSWLQSADLLKDVVHGKDCGSRSASAIIVEEGKISSRSTEGQFWSALSAKDSRPSGTVCVRVRARARVRAYVCLSVCSILTTDITMFSLLQ